VLAACAAVAGRATGAPAATNDPTVRWAVPVGEVDAAEDEVDGIGIAPDDSTVVSGVFRGRVQFGDTTFTSRGAGDIFLASFSPSGSLQWARQFGAAGDDNTFDLQLDGDGRIVASGWFSDEVPFGSKTLTSRGATDMFVAKFDSRGRTIWARQFGGPSGDGGNELDVRPDGEIAVAGISAGDFSAGGKTYPFGGGTRDSYVLRLRPSGKPRWVREFNGAGTERIRAMALGADGAV
jgi:hypothetical protein